MPTYVAERYLPRLTSEQLLAAGRRARHTTAGLTEGGTPVTYRGSTYVPEDETCFCLFEAPSADVVKEANRRAGLPLERVVEVIHVAGEGRSWT